MDNELILSAENGTEMEITGVSMKGDKGDPGYTPQKGVDYFTEEDIESLGLSAKEDVANKVTTITDASTDSQYPSAKAVYTGLTKKKNKKTILHPPDNIALCTDCDYRYTPKLTSLTVTIQSAAADFDCYISFTSGATPTSLAYSATPIKWVGVDCDADGDFVPSANTNYEISLRVVNIDDSGNPVIVARVGVY